MGNSKSNQTSVHNMKLLVTSLYAADLANIKLIFENTHINMPEYHNHLTIYHYLVLTSFHINPETLKNICDLFYKYHHLLGLPNIPAKYYRYVQYLKKDTTDGSSKYQISLLTSDEYLVKRSASRYEPDIYKKYTNIYKLRGLNPLHLCLELKTNFLNHNNYTIMIELFNRIMNNQIITQPLHISKLSNSKVTDNPIVSNPIVSPSNPIVNNSVIASSLDGSKLSNQIPIVPPLDSSNLKVSNSSIVPPLDSVKLSDSKVNDILMCNVCLDKAKDILLKPCNHLVCCDICIRSIIKCPLCRVQIESHEKIYI